MLPPLLFLWPRSAPPPILQIYARTRPNPTSPARLTNLAYSFAPSPTLSLYARTLSLYVRNSASMERIDQSHTQKHSGVTTTGFLKVFWGPDSGP